MIAYGFIDQLVTILGSARRYRFANEAELHDAIGALLVEVSIEHTREYVLSKEDRLDFYLPLTRTAIEVKVDGGLTDLTRQVHRYAQHEAVAGIVVVTSLARLARLPQKISGKPVRVVHLLGSCL